MIHTQRETMNYRSLLNRHLLFMKIPLIKFRFCPSHGKKNLNPRNVPDDLVTLARIVIPEMVICLYKKVKSQWDNETGEGESNFNLLTSCESLKNI